MFKIQKYVKSLNSIEIFLWFVEFISISESIVANTIKLILKIKLK